MCHLFIKQDYIQLMTVCYSLDTYLFFTHFNICLEILTLKEVFQIASYGKHQLLLSCFPRNTCILHNDRCLRYDKSYCCHPCICSFCICMYFRLWRGRKQIQSSIKAEGKWEGVAFTALCCMWFASHFTVWWLLCVSSLLNCLAAFSFVLWW